MRKREVGVIRGWAVKGNEGRERKLVEESEGK